MELSLWSHFMESALSQAGGLSRHVEAALLEAIALKMGSIPLNFTMPVPQRTNTCVTSGFTCDNPSALECSFTTIYLPSGTVLTCSTVSFDVSKPMVTATAIP